MADNADNKSSTQSETASAALQILQLMANPWLKACVGIGGAVIAIGTFWFTWQMWRGPELTYQVPKNQSLLSPANSGLDIRYNLVSVKEPYLTEVQIQNTGAKSIDLDSFTDKFPPFGNGLLLKSGNPACKILACNIISMHPSERYSPELQLVDNQAVLLKPIVLNAGDKFAVRLISESNPDPVRLWGNLAGCKIQKKEMPDLPLGTIWNGFLFIGAVLGILSFSILIFCYFGAKSVLEGLINGVVSGVGAVFSAFGQSSLLSKVQAQVVTSEAAHEILLDNAKFETVATKLGATTFEEKNSLREILSDFGKQQKPKGPT
jgi:hypothetical protein